MPSVLPRRHSAGSSALSALQFDLLFECGSAEEGAGALQSAASVGALGLSRPPLAPRGSGLKAPALRSRRGEATEDASPEALAAFARQLAAPRGVFSAAVAAAAASVALEAAAAAPPCDLPLSPGCEAAAATRLAVALRAAGYDALAVGEASAGGPSASSSPAGVHRTALHHRSRQPAWVVVDPAGSGRPGSALSDVLLVEPRLREQFEMPRPSAQLAAVLTALPPVFVGTERQLAALVTWLADRLRDAFDAAGMALPPWRSAASLLARWQLEETAAEAPPPPGPPPLPKRRGAAEELVLRQRNGVPFTAHVSTCSPRAAS